MKKYRWVSILSLFFFLALTGSDGSGNPPRLTLSAEPGEYVPGQVLVKFKPVLSSAGIRSMQDRIGAQSLREISFIRVHQIRLPSGWSVEQGVEFYRRNPNVEYAEPNYLRYAKATTPNDPSFSNLWGLNNTGQTVNGTSGTADADLNAPEAWDITTGSDTLVIAVLDSGVDYNHPDLAANIWSNPGETAGNGLDDDGNGYIDDVRGWDFFDDDNDPMDGHYHGSHVTGTIAARGNNGAGITGVCWRAKIMSLKVGNLFGTNIASVAAAIDYAWRNGAKIMNASIGGPNYSQTEYDALSSANSAGVLFVTAAGNESTNNDSTPSYPASYSLPNIVSVAATDQNDSLTSFSNFGAGTVHVAAPGTNVYSAQPARRVVWSDNFDDGDISNWTRGGTNDTWGLSNTVYNSASYSLGTSPSGNYLNDAASWASTPALDFSSYSGAKCTFRFKGESETGKDYLYVQTSTDGSNWTSQVIYFADLGAYGSAFSGAWNILWFTAEVDLGNYDGEATVYIRFYFTSDSSNTFGGFFIDDLSVTASSATYAGTEYTYHDGTSMASPHVAGVAGLIWSRYPAWTMSEVRNTLLSSVDRKNSLTGKVSSGGRVDAFNALRCHDTINSPTGLQGILAASGEINLTWTDNSGYEIGFKIERKLGVDGTYSQVGTSNTDSPAYNDFSAEPGKTYYYRVKTYNCAADSGYSNEVSVSTASPTSSGGSSTGGCFIATAAYGSSLAPQVQILRKFRDRFLLPSNLGQGFITAYARYSPPVARVIEQSELLKATVRVGLYPVVAFGYSCNQWGGDLTLAGSFILLGSLFFIGRRGRKRFGRE